jgi:signal transduction histidine kinase
MEGTVTVTATVVDGHYVVSVQDTGIGISAVKLLAIFSEGARFHASAQEKRSRERFRCVDI